MTYDHNLLHLQAQNLESVQWEMTLIEHTAGASWHALGIADSPAEALALKARFEKLPEVSRVVEVATLVPPDQASKLPLIAKIRQDLEYLPARGQTIAHFRPSSTALSAATVALDAKLGPLTVDRQIADLKYALSDLAGAWPGSPSALPRINDCSISIKGSPGILPRICIGFAMWPRRCRSRSMTCRSRSGNGM